MSYTCLTFSYLRRCIENIVVKKKRGEEAVVWIYWNLGSLRPEPTIFARKTPNKLMAAAAERKAYGAYT